MRRINSGSLNKEKLVFLVSALGVSVGVYFLASGPVPLVLNSPSTREPGPEPFKDTDLQQKKDINSLIDRDRVSPFEPFRPPQVVQPKVNTGPNNAPPPPPPPPPPPAEKPKEAKIFESEDPVSEVEYMGVTFVNGESRALLKPKDGSAPVLVAIGEAVPNFKYVVQKIEPQAVWISDGDNRPFMLKDASFSEDSSDAGSSSSKTAKPDKSDSSSTPSKSPSTTPVAAPVKTPKAGKQPKPKKPHPQPQAPGN